ncbi:hypothetical protein [Candidatus Poriferisodalis sp.]|uniref:hypothetical protein n=1 Tax=Candidatus Poriferisodalis sp. TaxID=3101277 RepID=UPI003B01E9EE
MNQIKWLNRSQPQPLYSAVLLSYFSAAFLLFESRVERQIVLDVFKAIVSLVVSERTTQNLTDAIVPAVVTLLLGGAFVAGGLGTASERRWGHWLCSSAAVYSTIATLWWGMRTNFALGVFMRMMFDALLLVLLFHPISRGYRRVWFT